MPTGSPTTPLTVLDRPPRCGGCCPRARMFWKTTMRLPTLRRSIRGCLEIWYAPGSEMSRNVSKCLENSGSGGPRFRDISRHLRFFANGHFLWKTGFVELFIGSLSMIWELGASLSPSVFSKNPKMSRNVSKSDFETFRDISRRFTTGRVPDFETPQNGPA